MLKDKTQFNICEECNADIIERVEEWSRDGLKSFLNWDEYMNEDSNSDIDIYEAIGKEIKADEEETEEIKENALLLLNGGADILNIDYEKFLKTIIYIENIGNDVNRGVDRGSIGHEWRRVLKEGV